MITSEVPVLIDISRMVWRRWSGRQPTGIDRACLAYLSHFSKGEGAYAVVQRGGFTKVLTRAHSRVLIDLLIDGESDFRRRIVGPLARALATPASDFRDSRGALYLNVGHTGLNLPGHARWVRSSEVRAIYYIHDIIPISHPEYCREGEPDRHRKRILSVFALASAIVTNSDDSARALVDFARCAKLAMPRMLVAPLGLTVAQQPSPAPPIAEPYFLLIGTIEGRKNHDLIFRAWRRLASKLGDATPKLVLIGARGWAASQVFEALDKDPVIRRHVIELGQCSDQILISYLTHAQALLFPSFAEGQGLPLAEALAVGTPVIASNLSVFREVAANIPDYASPLDLDAWDELLVDYSSPISIARSRQIERLRHFRAPRWETHFSGLERFLRDITL